MRTILRFLLWTLLIIAVAAGGTAWWFIYRPLPQLDGSISLPGLQKEVTVDRDNWGIPHIRAASLVDAVEAQGYVTAQDRLWQLDLMRRASRGQLSEIVGPLALKSDKQFRTFGFFRAADRDFAAMDKDSRALLEAYARGVNAFILQHQNNLPLEFSLLKYKPQPWQPTGTWRAIDLDRDGFLNEREWEFFRTRLASRNGLLAVKLGGSGDVTATHVLWRFEKSLPDVPTPLIYKDVVFLVRSGGIATTLDARTGKMLKQARLRGALEDYYSSPIGADGKVYIASEHGKVVVLRAAGDWEILAINDFDSDIYATPAISGGQMYIRTQSAIYAIGSSK